MEKDKKINVDKKIIAYAILAIIALVIVIIIFVSRLRNIGNTVNVGEPSYAGDTNVSHTEEQKEQRLERQQRSASLEKSGLDNLPSLNEVNYTRYAKMQFDKPNKDEDTVIFKFKNYKGEMKVKLFNSIAPNTVKEFEEAVEKGYFVGKEIAMETFADLIIPARDEDGLGVFKTGNENELNYSLVPYKGALVQPITDPKKQGFGRSFSIIMDNMLNDNLTVTRKMALNYTIKNELKQRGGRLYGTYLRSIIFGQVYEGMDIAEQIVKDYLDIEKRNGNEPYVVTIEDARLIKADNNIQNTNENTRNNIDNTNNKNNINNINVNANN